MNTILINANDAIFRHIKFTCKGYEVKSISSRDDFFKDVDGNVRCIVQEITSFDIFKSNEEKHFVFNRKVKCEDNNYTSENTSDTDEPKNSECNPIYYRDALFQAKNRLEARSIDTVLPEVVKYAIPIIFIGDDLYRSKLFTVEKNVNGKNIIKTEDWVKNNAICFMDSDIWHFYLPVDSLNCIASVLMKIEKLHKYNIYKTKVAIEHLDYVIRSLSSKYVESIGEQGHGKHISLYPFQSESFIQTSLMNELVVNEIKAFSEKNPNEKIIRVLLVDDYAEVGLRLYNGTHNKIQEQPIGKKILIENLLFLPVEITSVHSIREGLEKLMIANNAEMYDIILLDYLFTRTPEKGAKDNNHKDVKQVENLPQYCTKFLESLKEKFNDLQKGPGGKFWILPVSVFNEAVQSEMIISNISETDVEYTITTGADPICTPELFRWKMFSLVNMIEDKLFSRRELVEELLEKLGNIKIGYNSFDTSIPEKIWEILEEYYAEIVREYGKFIQLKNDAKKKSLCKLFKK